MTEENLARTARSSSSTISSVVQLPTRPLQPASISPPAPVRATQTPSSSIAASARATASTLNLAEKCMVHLESYCNTLNGYCGMCYFNGASNGELILASHDHVLHCSLRPEDSCYACLSTICKNKNTCAIRK